MIPASIILDGIRQAALQGEMPDPKTNAQKTKQAI